MFAWPKTALEENSTFVQHNFSYYYIFYAIKNNNKKNTNLANYIFSLINNY